MSFDDLVDVELDVRLSSAVVEESGEIPADDSELLARLDGAATVADGVESRLDNILDTLDDLLASLQPNDSVKPQEVTIPPQSEHEQSREHAVPGK